MESLLILIGIFVVNAVIKGMAAKKKQSSERGARSSKPYRRQIYPPPNQEQDSSGNYGRDSAPGPASNSTLQDLVRQFEEAQRQASQGTMEPAIPPTPPKPARNPNKISFEEIAETIIEVDVVSVEYLMNIFDIDSAHAKSIIKKLMTYKIIGRDMGDGLHDVLVHDKTELHNQINRVKSQLARAELQKKQAAETKEAELNRQQQLNALVNRVKEIRKAASASIAASASTDELATQTLVSRHFALAEVRRGFIWAKVLDEPRFKRRWSPRTR